MAAPPVCSLNPELNPICHLLALLGAHHIIHVSRIRVNACIGTSSPLTFLYRKGGLLDPEEEGVISFRRVGENLPINMS